MGLFFSLKEKNTHSERSRLRQKVCRIRVVLTAATRKTFLESNGTLGFLGLALVDDDLAAVVQLAFVPVGAVRKVSLSGYRANRNLLCDCMVMRTSFVSAGGTLASFRMCHFCISVLSYLTFYVFQFFPARIDRLFRRFGTRTGFRGGELAREVVGMVALLRDFQ